MESLQPWLNRARKTMSDATNTAIQMTDHAEGVVVGQQMNSGCIYCFSYFCCARLDRRLIHSLKTFDNCTLVFNTTTANTSMEEQTLIQWDSAPDPGQLGSNNLPDKTVNSMPKQNYGTRICLIMHTPSYRLFTQY